MQVSYQAGIVILNQEIEKGIYKLKIKGDFAGEPGQFYMLKSWETEPILARPISIHDVDHEGITFLYQVKGTGTKLFSKLTEGDSINLLGPLGKGFEVEKLKGKVAVVAGGIGVAPFLLTVKKAVHAKIDLYVGFREKDYVIDEFKEYVNHVYLATELGGKGYHGFVTDILNPDKYDCVIGCGPEVMMKKIVQMCKVSHTKVYVSLESHMACGIGACLVCACATKYGNQRVCKDGPVFSGEDVFVDA